MDKVQLFDKKFKKYISQEEIEKAISKVAEKLNEDYKNSGKIPVLLCILNGSIIFTSELMKRLDFQLEVVSMKLTSYQGESSTGVVKQAMGLTSDIKGKEVIVVEDIVDTGLTIVEINNILEKAGVEKIKFCTLLLKPEVYDKNIKLDYVGMEIPNKFIVGYGLDYLEIGRNLNDIYVIDED